MYIVQLCLVFINYINPKYVLVQRNVKLFLKFSIRFLFCVVHLRVLVQMTRIDFFSIIHQLETNEKNNITLCANGTVMKEREGETEKESEKKENKKSPIDLKLFSLFDLI